MNKTKWTEIRDAMLALTDPPQWSTLSTNGYTSVPDGEWFYHLGIGGYEDIVHLDIHVETSDQRDQVRHALRVVHVPGQEMSFGFRIFGHLTDGQVVEYI
jgi:hypothetical protein